MQRILVQIAEMPGVMRDLVTNVVAAQADMEIVPDLGTGSPHAPARAADVVIVALPTSANGAAITAQRFAHPGQRILGLVADGRRAVLYELRPHVTELGEISPDGLVAAIRAGVHAAL